MRFVIAVIVCSFCIGSFGAREALALSEFKKAFQKKYVDEHKSEEFKAAYKKASCNVCHVKGAKKSVQNQYGKLLNKLIEGEANARKKAAKAEGGVSGQKAEVKKLLDELEKAFHEVAKKEKTKDGPTFGELLKEGQLPVDPVKAAEEYKKAKAKAEKEAT